GASRSGTTMMGRALGGHPDVYVFDELHFFEQIWSPDRDNAISNEHALEIAGTLLWVQRHGYLTRWQATYYREEAQAIVDCCKFGAKLSAPAILRKFLEYEATLHGKTLSCEQTPRNLFYLDEIFDAFPDARVIYMVRDPRDVLLSQKNRWRRRFLGSGVHRRRDMIRDWSNYHPMVIPRLWLGAEISYSRWADDPRVMRVRYEDLVASAGEQLGGICDFVGIAYHPDMSNVPQNGSSSRVDQSDRLGFDASRIGAWKRGGLSSGEIYLCERITNDMLCREGYEVTNPGLSLSVGYYYLTLPFRLGFAFITNWGRVKNVRQAILRRIGQAKKP
ncbi:MAG: sulfotransferase family protein, partial [Candidatus Micrarchaeaceae archaeon]